MTEVEQAQRLLKIVATMPPHVLEALTIFIEWLNERDKQ